MALNKKQRMEVRAMFGERCAYCGTPLGEKWHADHVEAVLRDSVWVQSTDERRGYFKSSVMLRPENDRIENNFPACIPCNIDKGCIPLEDWRVYLNERIVDGIRRKSSTFRHAERFGRVIIVREPLVFWFENFRAAPVSEQEGVER